VGADSILAGPRKLVMAKGYLLKMAGTASFAVALATPWPFGDDWVSFVADLTGIDVVIDTAGRVEPPHSPRRTSVAAPAPAQVAPEAAKGPRAPEIVVVVPRVDEQPTRMPGGWSQHIVPSDRAAVTRELQRELKRVGCYDGEVHGVWTPAVRKAMSAFIERINAVLPTEEPDQILLALVRGHANRACGVACPSGQAMDADGRCVPAAILAARKNTRTARPDTQPSRPVEPAPAWATTTRIDTTAPAPLPQGPPMGLAGPQPPGHPTPADGAPATPLGAEPPASAPPTAAARPAPAPRPAQQVGFGPSLFRHIDRNGY
jgi:hypothetical protein